jgi:predicted nuclease of predicted toxin-antitoxin system
MKLLFDQNISFRIIRKVGEFLPFATQVRLLGLENAKDLEIWEYAKVNSYTIITFDAVSLICPYLRELLQKLSGLDWEIPQQIT